jgi:hypothetical protein
MTHPKYNTGELILLGDVVHVGTKPFPLRGKVVQIGDGLEDPPAKTWLVVKPMRDFNTFIFNPAQLIFIKRG